MYQQRTNNNPLRTPSRWAKRQTDMKKSTIVLIEQLENKVIVSNDKGKKWELPFTEPYDDDSSVHGVVAHIASAMLTGTIASQLRHVITPFLRFTLTVETDL